MNRLSPQSEAVWSAYNEVMERVGVFEDCGDAIAAALRAAVEHTQKNKVMTTFGVTMAQSVPYCLASEILAIAAELEGHSDA